MAAVTKINSPWCAHTTLPPSTVRRVMLGIFAAVLVECVAQNIEKLALFRRVTELDTRCHDIDDVALVKVLDVLDAAHDIDVVNEYRVRLVRAHDTAFDRRRCHNTQTLLILDAARRHHQLLFRWRHRVGIRRIDQSLVHHLVGSRRLDFHTCHRHASHRHRRRCAKRIVLIVTTHLEHSYEQLDQLLAATNRSCSCNKLASTRHVGSHLANQTAQIWHSRLLVFVRQANLLLQARARTNRTTQARQQVHNRLCPLLNPRRT